MKRNPPPVSSADIRTAFLDFFQRHHHRVMPSASLVPHNDPTLLFTTAGMVPFKDYFTGQEHPPASTLASCQKCVRSGGKHNDLDQVGHTRRHHTFFEMLGNFSFGGYFKEGAITLAWEFLTQCLNLPQEKLWITVYHEDQEAFELWQDVAGVSPQRIIKIASQDNFWSAGETGPCGPCSEIFYDHGPQVPGGLPGSPNEGDRYVELWNLVFMQFNQKEPGIMSPLDRPCIDTGMGLERVAAVMQGVNDNFDTDILGALVQGAQRLCDTAGLVLKTQMRTLAQRVIADHMRSISFLISDGILPSNEGRGYVLRRIMRRALRWGQNVGIAAPDLLSLMPILIEKMGQTYPELMRARPLVESTLLQEGERFQSLLERAGGLLERWIQDMPTGSTTFSGEKAFQLYDTYGLPMDLTQDLLQEKGLTLDEEVFYACMAQQRAHSKAIDGGPLGQEKGSIISHGGQEPCLFLGYEHLSHTSAITHILTMTGQEVDLCQGPTWEDEPQGESRDAEGLCSWDSTPEFWIMVQESPFYGESGGQVGDRGWVKGPQGWGCIVDTQKKGERLFHALACLRGTLRVGDVLQLRVDRAYRQRLAVHHSATHLLNAALRTVLGPHISQKGSLVDGDKLRFDFSHPGPISAQDCTNIERLVNTWIRENHPVSCGVMPYDQAMEKGATTLMGEVYDDNVRVIAMGGVSIELCGGTHVQRTGDIGIIKLTGQSAVAAGIRRLEAVAGEMALAYVQDQCVALQQACEKAGANTQDLTGKITQWQESIKTLQRTQKDLMFQALQLCPGKSAAGVSFIFAHFPGGDLFQDLSPKDLCVMAQSLGRRHEVVMVALPSDKDKVMVALVSHHQGCDAAGIMKGLFSKSPQEQACKGGGGAKMAQGNLYWKDFATLKEAFVQILTHCPE